MVLQALWEKKKKNMFLLHRESEPGLKKIKKNEGI